MSSSGAVRWMWVSVSMSSGTTSGSRFGRISPALWTMWVTSRPVMSMAASAVSCGSSRSAQTDEMSGWSIGAGRRATQITFQPASSMSRHSRSPMPALPPVTTAV